MTKIKYKHKVGDKVKFHDPNKAFGNWFLQCRITERLEKKGEPHYIMESAIGNTMECHEDEVVKRT